MEKTYAASDNKLVISTPSTSEVSIETLLEQKATLENLIASTLASKDAEVAIYQENLDGVNTLIAKANELGVEPSPVAEQTLPVEEIRGTKK